MKRLDAYGSYSACCASLKPRTFRAYSIMMCWNPPHVPRQGTLFSRAWRIAQSVLSMSLYGLPGVTQMPENRSNRESFISSVDTQKASTSTPDSRAECSMAAFVETCGGKL